MSGVDKAGRDLASDRVFMVKQGLFSGWVCAPKLMSLEEVQVGVNLHVFPSGTTAGWQVQSVTEGDDDQLSPGLCAEDCGRQHWLVVA